MIVQNISVDGMTDFSFTVARTEYAKAMEVSTPRSRHHIGAADIIGDPKICKVSVVASPCARTWASPA